MNELISDSLKYPFRSDTFLRTIAIGGIFTFAEQLSLRAILAFLAYDLGFAAYDDGINAPFLEGASMAIQGGLVALALVSFVVLTGFYVRIAECVISGKETPPGFADGTQLVSDGTVFCVTLLAIVAVVLAAELAVGLVLFAFLVVVEAYLGIPSLTSVIFVLWFVFGIIPVAIVLVYPQPFLWILIARFRLRSEPDRSYFRFVASRRFISELESILLSRKYVTSWAALIVVSILNGAATIRGDSVIATDQPVDLIIGLNVRFVSAIIGFYASVAVVYIFATRFRDCDRYRQTSLLDFDPAS
jgi:hypothetical protein